MKETKMRKSHQYLLGFIDGYNVPEISGEESFPEDAKDINDVYDLLEDTKPMGVLCIDSTYWDALTQESKDEITRNWHSTGPIQWLNPKPKILLVGHGTHGKDEVGKIFQKHGYKFKSSSRAACEIFIYDHLKDKYRYKTLEECYQDRNSSDEMRAEWYDLICAYNLQDKSRLAKEIMKENDIYVGLRSKEELDRCIEENVFDLIIWVDASERLDYREPETSMTIDKSYADIIIDNNGTLEDLERRVERLIKVL